MVGAGSIGRRHISNLRSLGLDKLASFDTNPERREYAERELQVEIFSSLESALEGFKPEIVLICTPPVHHVAQSLQAIRAGAHVFIEKPLSDRMEHVDELLRAVADGQVTAQVGYNLRFHAPLEKLKQLVQENAVGKIIWGRVEAGSYLPTWRPWQDYRKSYTARRELGGGIILDGSHELDYATWLFGTPCELTCFAGKVSRLEVDVEDCATVLMRFASGTQLDVHVDFVQRTPARGCVLAGEEGTLTWDLLSNRVEVLHSDGTRDSIQFDSQPNDMYVAEMQHFLDCVENGRSPRFTLDEAVLSLRLALAARSCAAERRWVNFG